MIREQEKLSSRKWHESPYLASPIPANPPATGPSYHYGMKEGSKRKRMIGHKPQMAGWISRYAVMKLGKKEGWKFG